MRVLLTGATGDLGSRLRPLLRERYDDVVLSSRSELEDVQPGETFHQADLSDREALDAAVQGVDGIIHMGGVSSESAWDTVMAANIDGVHNLYEAARSAGVRRVVFASSVHAMGFWPIHRRIGVEARPRPDTRYGLSKVFGEGISSLYADKFGLRTLSIRIGACEPEPLSRLRLPIWLHPDDLFQLCTIGLEHPDIHNQIVYGASANASCPWDNAEANRLGYRPGYRAEDFDRNLPERLDDDPVTPFFEGIDFAAEEFDGDLQRTLWS